MDWGNQHGIEECRVCPEYKRIGSPVLVFTQFKLSLLQLRSLHLHHMMCCPVLTVTAIACQRNQDREMRENLSILFIQCEKYV